MSPQITFLGTTNFRSEKKKFGIRLDDRRRHIYIVGKTGVGKSTLLENMIIDDIRAGHGLAFLDPHGDSAEKILDFIPEERMEDVIYIDPSDTNFPIAFNPLEQVGSEFRHLVASGIMGVFKKIWVDAWSARMEYILNNTLLALLEFPNTTLLDIMKMLNDATFRKRVVDNLKDPVIKSFWTNEFARYSQKFETEATAAIQNKVGQFISNPLIRNILGQVRSSINPRQIMDESKILIVNLSKGKIGEDNSALLGAMMITKLQLAAMSRVDVSEEKRQDFYLYVDEFQNFSTDSFANILSEARKYHLSLTIANQYLDQLDEKGKRTIRSAIFGNVGTIVVFRVGAEDAEFLEKEFMPEFVANDLVNLAKYNIYIKLMIDGIASRPFSSQTLSPYPKPEKSFKAEIIENVHLKYSVSKKLVEEKIAGEWSTESQQSAEKKIYRREERPLREALKPRSDFSKPSNPVPTQSPLRWGSPVSGGAGENRPAYTGRPAESPLRQSSSEASEARPPLSGGRQDRPFEKNNFMPREKKVIDVDGLKKAIEKSLSKDVQKNDKSSL